jgi:outer membrane protein assembly factor BamB
VGDRVLVTCSSGPQQEQLHVMCFRAQDGRLLWQRRFWATGRTMTHEKTCVATPTPVCDGQRIFALFSSNDLVCLDLEGNLLWIRGLTLDYPNVSNSLGLASSPALVQDTLVIQVDNDSDSVALGLDANTGLNRWKKQRPKAANWTSPLVVWDPQTDQPVVALQSSAGLHALNPATGADLWSYLGGASTIPSSTSLKGIFYVPSHGITALKPAPASPAPVQLWRSGQLRPAVASPLAWKGRLYILNSAGILTCGNADTGKRLWQLRLKGPFSATPIAAGHHLYCINEKGLLQVVDVTASEGALVGSLDFKETILSTPSADSHSIYVRSDRHLWKLGSQ